MEIKTNTEVCFGGINCDAGYVGFYDQCFKGAKRLLILKGGPGTGKSFLVKQAAKMAKERGEAALLIHCGADAGSLDGIYLPQRGCGILDGTSPHVMEPDLPGIDGEIVNLGQYWDRGRLLAKQEELVSLKDAKRGGYQSLYRLLAAMGTVRREIRCRIGEALDREKLEKAAKRTVDAMRGEGEGTVRQMRAFGMGGEVLLPNRKGQCISLIGIRDEFGLGGCYLQALRDFATQKGIAYQISFHPIYHEELQTLTFPGSGIAYTASVEDTAVHRNIHLRRFLDPDAYIRIRSGCKTMMTACETIGREAGETMARIAKAHFAMEAHYSAAMDFERAGQDKEHLLSALFDGKNGR